MSAEDLRQEIAIELEAIDKVVEELSVLQNDLEGREPTVREKTAAGAFLAQFYNGIENILKRICVYCDVTVPVGDAWHVELFQLYCSPPQPPLPCLFDDSLASELAPFRKFRHVFFHGYGFYMDWDRMKHGVSTVEHLLKKFKTRLEAYLVNPGR